MGVNQHRRKERGHVRRPDRAVRGLRGAVRLAPPAAVRRRRAVSEADHAGRRDVPHVRALPKRARLDVPEHAAAERRHALRPAGRVVRPRRSPGPRAVFLRTRDPPPREPRHRGCDPDPRGRRRQHPGTRPALRVQLRRRRRGDRLVGPRRDAHRGVEAQDPRGRGQMVRARAGQVLRHPRPQRGLSVAPRRPREVAAGARHEGSTRHAASTEFHVAAPLPGRGQPPYDPHVVLLLRRAA